MQWPPTKPGLKFKKFHFVEAAFKTEFKFILSFLQIFPTSLTKAILISLCAFSIALADSATLILSHLNTPGFIIFE